MMLIRMEYNKLIRSCTLWAIFSFMILFNAWITINHHTTFDSDAWTYLLYYNYREGSVFMALILLMGLANSFAEERRIGMDALLLSGVNGRLPLMKAKVFSAVLFTCTMFVLFQTFNVLINIALAGIGGWEESLKMIKGFANTPFPLEVWQYAWIQGGTHLLGSISFALLILALSARLRSVISIYFAGGLVLVIPNYIRSYSELDFFWILKNVPMIETMRVMNWFSRPRMVQWEEWTISLPLWGMYSYIILLSAAMFLYMRYSFLRWTKG